MGKKLRAPLKPLGDYGTCSTEGFREGPELGPHYDYQKVPY